ncbi:ParB/RepB/Spo0J family partition protein [Promicromonospora soli]
MTADAAAGSVLLLSPDQIVQNPENPRIIFREEELRELQDSIAQQGILVPLTVYRTGSKFVILDGERRWRCARRLALSSVPVIAQPEPTKIQNIMMMFAIHHTRKQWDPLPTAYKLQQLEDLYFQVEGRRPNEAALAQLASISRGEVRRLKNMLALPEHFRAELMEEGEKPRSEQRLTVDHVLEATRGARTLRQRNVIDESTANNLTEAIVDKFRHGTLTSTVEPRQLARMARAVERKEVTSSAVARAVDRLIVEPSYTIGDAFKDSVARADLEHTVEMQVRRLRDQLRGEVLGASEVGPRLLGALDELTEVVAAIQRRFG